MSKVKENGKRSAPDGSLQAAKRVSGPTQADLLIRHMNGSGTKPTFNLVTNQNIGKRPVISASDTMKNFRQHYLTHVCAGQGEHDAYSVYFIKRDPWVKAAIAELLKSDKTPRQIKGLGGMMKPLHDMILVKRSGKMDGFGKIPNMTQKQPVDCMVIVPVLGCGPFQEHHFSRKIIQEKGQPDKVLPAYANTVSEGFSNLVGTIHEIIEDIWNHEKVSSEFKTPHIDKALHQLGWKRTGSRSDNTFQDENGNMSDELGSFGTTHPLLKAAALLNFKRDARVCLTSEEQGDIATEAEEGDGMFGGAETWADIPIDGDYKFTHLFGRRRTFGAQEGEYTDNYDPEVIIAARNKIIRKMPEEDIVEDTKEYYDPAKEAKIIKFANAIGMQFKPTEYINSDGSPYVLPPPNEEEEEMLRKNPKIKRIICTDGSIIAVDISFRVQWNKAENGNPPKLMLKVFISQKVKILDRATQTSSQQNNDIVKSLAKPVDFDDLPEDCVQLNSINDYLKPNIMPCDEPPEDYDEQSEEPQEPQEPEEPEEPKESPKKDVRKKVQKQEPPKKQKKPAKPVESEEESGGENEEDEDSLSI